MSDGNFSSRLGQTQILSVVIITGILVAVIGTSYMWGVPLIEKGQSNNNNEQAESFMLLLKQKIDDVASTGEQRTIDIDLNGDLEILDDNSINYKITTRGLNIASTAWVPLAGGISPIEEDMAAVSASSADPNLVSINGSETCYMIANCPAQTVNLSSCEPDDSIGDAVGTIYGVGSTFDLNMDTYSVHHVDCDGSVDGQALIVGPERERIGIVGIDEAGVVIAKSKPLGDMYETNYRLVYRELDDIESSSRNGYKITLKRDGNNILTAGKHKITIRRADNPMVAGKSMYGGDLFETEVYIVMS